jgi:hypothetical protein
MLLSSEVALICEREQEEDMERGLLAPLSPNEEKALRRVAHGISKPKHLRDAPIARLKQLALVEEQDGRIRLTELGVQRVADGRTVASAA